MFKWQVDSEKRDGFKKKKDEKNHMINKRLHRKGMRN